MMLACLQGQESWTKYFYWKLPAAGVDNPFLSVKAAGAARATVRMHVESLATERIDKKDNVNIVTAPKVEKHIGKMKIDEKIAKRKKRWATQLQTSSLP